MPGVSTETPHHPGGRRERHRAAHRPPRRPCRTVAGHPAPARRRHGADVRDPARSTRRWRAELAATGLVVAGVEFRNAGGRLGPHPFPAGLDDWRLRPVLDGRPQPRNSASPASSSSGESGGGNLTLATVLKAKRDGRLAAVAGRLTRSAPSISNAYAEGDPDLPSLVENDGYGLSCALMASLSRLYDSGRQARTGPARLAAARGRGGTRRVTAARHLGETNSTRCATRASRTSGSSLRAGVSAGKPNHQRHEPRPRTWSCAAAMPDVYLTTVRDIKGFADRVCGSG